MTLAVTHVAHWRAAHCAAFLLLLLPYLLFFYFCWYSILVGLQSDEAVVHAAALEAASAFAKYVLKLIAEDGTLGEKASRSLLCVLSAFSFFLPAIDTILCLPPADNRHSQSFCICLLPYVDKLLTGLDASVAAKVQLLHLLGALCGERRLMTKALRLALQLDENCALR